MMPQTRRVSIHFSAIASISGAVILATLVGCNQPLLRKREQSKPTSPRSKETQLVGDVAIPFGTHSIQVESVVLVTNLKGTGSDPAPSAARAALMSEMQSRGVARAGRILNNPNTSLALATTVLRPGIQKGDRIDVHIGLLPDSETTSLRGGWVLKTRLKEVAVLGQQIHTGNEWAVAEGPLMVEPSANKDSNSNMLREGVILGGGIALKSRNLSLVVQPDEGMNLRSRVRLASKIANSINHRFHMFTRGQRRGVSVAKEDDYIDLMVHPRYGDNLMRYLQVVRSIAVSETIAQRDKRMNSLEIQLLDPATSATAAIRLEAIGKHAAASLERGINSDNPEVRFYAAEALAYLDGQAAIEPLGQAAEKEEAFRAFALTALGAMDNIMAYDELTKLLHMNSAETRYGAFRVLWSMNSQDPLVRGEKLAEDFYYHKIPSQGSPMVHVTRSFRPEIVVFGDNPSLHPPVLLEAGNSIIVRDTNDGQLVVSRFAVGEPDEKRTIAPDLDSFIRAIVDLGGTYPDVVDSLQQAKQSNVLTCRLEVDAVPRVGRVYKRPQNPLVSETADASPSDSKVSSPLPDLFAQLPWAKEKVDKNKSSTSAL